MTDDEAYKAYRDKRPIDYTQPDIEIERAFLAGIDFYRDRVSDFAGLWVDSEGGIEHCEDYRYEDQP